jgi:hypothetical protein
MVTLLCVNQSVVTLMESILGAKSDRVSPDELGRQSHSRSSRRSGQAWDTCDRHCAGRLTRTLSLPGTDLVVLVIKLRRLVSLSVEYIVNRLCDAALVPQVSLAALLGPRSRVPTPTPVLAHLFSRVGFECGQRALGFSRPDTYDDMNVVCPDVQSMKIPSSIIARGSDCVLNGVALRRVQNYWLALENASVVTMSSRIGLDVGRLVAIMKTIN